MPLTKAAVVIANGAREARRYVALITSTTTVDVCAVVGKWSAEGYAPADQPKVLALLKGGISSSPTAAIGAGFAQHGFTSWGFSRTTSKQLIAEFNKALGRYQVLNAAAGRQYIDWLRQQAIYQLMQPIDRDAIAFDRYQALQQSGWSSATTPTEERWSPTGADMDPVVVLA